MTANAQPCSSTLVVCHVPDNLSAVATFTGISATNDDGSPMCCFLHLPEPRPTDQREIFPRLSRPGGDGNEEKFN